VAARYIYIIIVTIAIGAGTKALDNVKAVIIAIQASLPDIVHFLNKET